MSLQRWSSDPAFVTTDNLVILITENLRDVNRRILASAQLSTIQVDFQLPQRFELEYVGPDGDKHRPIMIHRALMGSIERFFGVLIEHYAGAFPAWLAPVQVRILPVADTHDDYAREVAAQLRVAGFRVDVVAAEEQLGKRIRNAKMQKLPEDRAGLLLLRRDQERRVERIPFQFASK